MSGVKPLRIYLNREGIVRIASHKYSLNLNSIKDKYVHLTNSGLNSKNKDFIFPNKNNNNNNNKKANMWDLKTYKKHLGKKGVNIQLFLSKIKDIIIKSIISVYQKLIEKLKVKSLIESNYYNLLGYDIIVTNKYEPMLLEINYSPAMINYTNLDAEMKTNLFIDTLNLIGIVPYSKNNIFNFEKDYQSDMKKGKAVDNALCELSRPRGDYELIFPLNSNIMVYKKYFKNIIEENELFWKKIK